MRQLRNQEQTETPFPRTGGIIDLRLCIGLIFCSSATFLIEVEDVTYATSGEYKGWCIMR